MSTRVYCALKFKRPIAGLLAVASLAACSSTAVVGPIAGAPSSHTARAYETMDSTAAVTSRLGGSVLRWDVGSTTPSSVRLTGNYEGSSGHTSLNDGAYDFVYQQKRLGLSNKISDKHGAYGHIGTNRFAGTYAYVRPFDITYPAPNGGTGRGGFVGFAGMITAAGDMPSGGSATYTGEAAVDMYSHGLGASSPTLHLDRGVSTITADFAAGTATVDMGTFSGRTNGTNLPISATVAQFDQVTGSGLTISGSHLTGGNWAAFKNGAAVVNVVGANQTANSNGTFYGYKPAISAPDEVAGVFVVNGSTSIITGRYIANAN